MMHAFGDRLQFELRRDPTNFRFSWRIEGERMGTWLMLQLKRKMVSSFYMHNFV